MEDNFEFQGVSLGGGTRVFILGRKTSLGAFSAAHIKTLLEKLHCRTGFMMSRCHVLITSKEAMAENANAMKSFIGKVLMVNEVVPAIEEHLGRWERRGLGAKHAALLVLLLQAHACGVWSFVARPVAKLIASMVLASADEWLWADADLVAWHKQQGTHKEPTARNAKRKKGK
jgi:hypothetical protein